MSRLTSALALAAALAVGCAAPPQWLVERMVTSDGTKLD